MSIVRSDITVRKLCHVPIHRDTLYDFDTNHSKVKFCIVSLPYNTAFRRTKDI